MGARPVENRLELVPVIDLVERQVLDRGSGDDETVIVVVAEGIQRLIELDQVIVTDMGRFVGGCLHEVDFDLQRRFGDQAQQLRLGFDLLGHQIQDHQFERSHTLALRLGLLQGEDAFRVEDGTRGQAAWDLDRHVLIMAMAGILIRRQVIAMSYDRLSIPAFHSAQKSDTPI